MNTRYVGRHLVPFASVVIVVSALLDPWIGIGVAETPAEAIRRIDAGRHNPMPAPAVAPATGPAGKGLTIENGARLRKVSGDVTS